VRVSLSRTIYVSAAAVAILATSGAAVANRYKVTITDNGHRKIVRGVVPKTVGGLLESEGISPHQGMLVFPVPNTPVCDGMSISVSTFRTISLNDGGKISRFGTYAETVGDFLQEQGITLGPKDLLNYQMNVPLQDGQSLRITRRQTRIMTHVEKIPYRTVYKYSDDLFKGQTRVVSHGKTGSLRVRHISDYVNSHRVQYSEQKQVIAKAANRIVEIGTKRYQAVLSSRDGSLGPLMQAMTVVATAYTGGGTTAAGWQAGPGIIAVDPSVIPLGTKVYIPGMGVACAEDTGGAISGNRIDIWMGNESDAMNFGVRTVTIYVLN
jgi:3D (Asp-Asp-Asp) domain-containing protein